MLVFSVYNNNTSIKNKMKKIETNIDKNGTLKNNSSCAIKIDPNTKKRILIFPKLNIKQLNQELFKGYNKAQEIYIPETVQKIGDKCFILNTGLEKIIIPDSVEQLGNYCFQFCNNLKDIKLSKNIQKLPDYCFYGCSSLEEITIPEELTELGEKTFAGCNKIKHINLPINLRQVGKYSFSHCKSMETFVFNDNITCIPEGFLSICKKLSTVVLPKRLESIDCLAFEGNTNLASITFPNTLKYIGEKAFAECPSLTQITIPENVEKIDFNAFENCTNLQTINILSNNIKCIEEGAFRGCYNVQELCLAKEMLRDDIFDFDYMKNLKKITYDNKQILNLNNDEKLDDLTNNGKYIHISYTDCNKKLVHNVIKQDISNTTDEHTKKFLKLYNHNVFKQYNNDYKKNHICLNMMSILDFDTCVRFLDLLATDTNIDTKLHTNSNTEQKNTNVKKDNIFTRLINKLSFLIHRKDIKNLPEKNSILDSNTILEKLFKDAEVNNNSEMFNSFFISNITDIASIDNMKTLRQLCNIQKNFNYFINNEHIKKLIENQKFTLVKALQYYDLCMQTNNSESPQEKRISRTKQIEKEMYEEITKTTIIGKDKDDEYNDR